MAPVTLGIWLIQHGCHGIKHLKLHGLNISIRTCALKLWFSHARAISSPTRACLRFTRRPGSVTGYLQCAPGRAEAGASHAHLHGLLEGVLAVRRS